MTAQQVSIHMAEPLIAAAGPALATVVVASLSASVLSTLTPYLSQYLLILIGGFFGGMFALNNVPEDKMQGRWKPLIFLIRAEGAAVIFSSLGSTILANRIGVQIDILWMPVSGVIAMYAHRVHDLTSIWIQDIGDTAVSVLKSKFGGKK